MAEVDITPSSGNVFSDLGFDPDDAAVMLIRIEVAAAIFNRVQKNGWTSAEAAHQLGITEQLLSQIISSKLVDLSLDTLWMIAVRSGLNLRLQFC